MIIVYANKILVVSKDTSTAIYYLEKSYVLIDGSMGPPEQYLVANIKKAQTANGSIMWETHSADHCKAAITNLEKYINTDGKRLLKYDNGKRT